MYRIATLCLAALLPACGGAGGPDTAAPEELEGDDADECADGADNDADGAFDCDDDDCAGSPDCAPTETTTTTTPTNADSGSGDTGGATLTDGPIIDVLPMPGCGGSNSAWRYFAETSGWTDGASNRANVWETSAAAAPYPIWNEEHELPSIAFTDSPRRDVLERILADEASLNAYQENVNTLFTCGVHDQGNSNTYVFRVYDMYGNLADCAVLDDSGTGQGADIVFAGPDDVNPTTDPEEIRPANCIIW